MYGITVQVSLSVGCANLITTAGLVIIELNFTWTGKMFLDQYLKGFPQVLIDNIQNNIILCMGNGIFWFQISKKKG